MNLKSEIKVGDIVYTINPVSLVVERTIVEEIKLGRDPSEHEYTFLVRSDEKTFHEYFCSTVVFHEEDGELRVIDDIPLTPTKPQRRQQS